MRLPLEERRQLVELLAAGVDQLARRRMLAPWCCAQASSGSPPFEAAGQRPERLLRRLQLARRRSRAGDRSAASMPSSSFSFCSNLSRPRRNEARARRRRRRFRDSRCRRRPPATPRSARRRDRRAGAVVDVGKRARQIVVDELEGAAHRLDADLDEDAGRILDVVARRLNQPRRLAQLRQDAAGALGGGRVGEQRLAGQARREDVGVELRVASPRCARSRARTCGRGCARSSIRCSRRSIGGQRLRGRFRRGGADSRRARALRLRCRGG